METGQLVLDLITQREFLVVGKLVNGEYLLMEDSKYSQESIEELVDDKSTIINDTEVILRYSHQIEEI